MGCAGVGCAGEDLTVKFQETEEQYRGRVRLNGDVFEYLWTTKELLTIWVMFY